MNEHAFFEGVGHVLKQGGLAELFKQYVTSPIEDYVVDPAVRGYSDENLGGMVRYDNASSSIQPNRSRVTSSALSGQVNPVQQRPQDMTGIRGLIYDVARSGPARSLVSKTPAVKLMNDQAQSMSDGVFSVGGDGRASVDQSKVPGAFFNRAKAWAGQNKNMLIGGGLALGALGLAGMAGRKRSQASQPAPNAGQPVNRGRHGGYNGTSFTRAVTA